MVHSPAPVHKRFEWRFEVLLILLLVLLSVAPALKSGVILGLCTSFVFISAVTSFHERRALKWIAWTLFVFATVSLWAGELSGRMNLVVLSSLLECAFYATMTYGILRWVFRAEKIDQNVLAASICAYLIIGLGWASLYVMIENLSPGSFSSGALAVDGGDGLASPRLQQSHFAYFSLVTLSTLGYGDITPLKPAVRNVAALEAIIGQLFIGVLIARLVSQQVSSNASRS